MITNLVANFAVIGLFAAIWINAQDWALAQPPLRTSIWFGALMGTASLIVMAITFEVDGYLIDLRAVPIAVAALLGGWLPGLIALSVTAIARLILGGPGATLGIASAFLAFAIAFCGHALIRMGTERRAVLAVSAALVGLRSLALWPIVDPAAREIIAAGIVPTALANGIGVLVIGYAIMRGRDRAESNALLLGAASQAPDYFYVKDTHSRIVAANRNVALIQGFESPDQLRGLTDIDLEPSSDRAAELLAEEHQVMASRVPVVDRPEEVVGKDGIARTFVTSKSPVLTGSGELVGIVGVTKDVTKVSQLQRDVAESRDRLAFVLAEMSDGVALFNSTGRILLTNDRYREFFPRTGHLRVEGGFLPTILQAVLDTDEQPAASTANHREWMASVMHALRAGGDELVQLFDGRWLQLRTRVNANGIAVMVVSDITSVKRAEIDLLVMTKRLELLSITDGLTQLVNRRGFDEALKREFARSRRTDAPLSVIMLDIDRFKAFNDRYGHLAGDDALVKVGEAVTRAVKRPGDFIARYGGEEIAVILTDTTLQGAYQVAENIRHEIRGLVIAHEASEKGVVTASLGVASADPQDPSMSEKILLAHADEALYLAKSSGRDRVIAWSDQTNNFPQMLYRPVA